MSCIRTGLTSWGVGPGLVDFFPPRLLAHEPQRRHVLSAGAAQIRPPAPHLTDELTIHRTSLLSTTTPPRCNPLQRPTRCGPWSSSPVRHPGIRLAAATITTPLLASRGCPEDQTLAGYWSKNSQWLLLFFGPPVFNFCKASWFLICPVFNARYCSYPIEYRMLLAVKSNCPLCIRTLNHQPI